MKMHLENRESAPPQRSLSSKLLLVVVVQLLCRQMTRQFSTDASVADSRTASAYCLEIEHDFVPGFSGPILPSDHPIRISFLPVYGSVLFLNSSHRFVTVHYFLGVHCE